MRKKILSSWSVLLVLIVSLVVLVPGCKVEGERTTGTIEVNATLDDAPWSGPMEYTLTGPGTPPTIIYGHSVPSSHDVEVGDWHAAYESGGPIGEYATGLLFYLRISGCTPVGSYPGEITFVFETEPTPPDDSNGVRTE